MQLNNLQIRDVILHEVHKRGNDREPIQPDYGTAVEQLEPEALDALSERVHAAMTSPTRCVEMAITRSGPESMIGLAAELVESDLANYIRLSCGVADKLTQEQQSRQIPGGVLVVFRGSTGAPARRLIGVIKAEIHTGFTREKNDEGPKLKFLKQLMLTAQTKLYKIGLFVEERPHAVGELQNRWEAHIYDETLTMGNRDGAAKYFYEGFLGLGFPASSARQTKRFHEYTKTFIQELNVEEEEKVVLFNALVTYLKADQTPTVGTEAFATAYFGDEAIQDAYRVHMAQKGFPDEPVNKDISDLRSALRTRQLRFHNKIRVSGPADEFERLVEIRSVDGDEDAEGRRPQWTQLTIKDRISGQD